MSGPAFSVIIPVFNKWELTGACLRSLREHTPGYEFEVIVADNGSSDATASELLPLGRSLFGRNFQRLRFEENRNFGPACNAGAEAAGADLIFFLNNDTLLTPNWAPPLLRALEKETDAGGVGPLLLYEDDTVQHLGICFSLFTVEHLYRSFPRSHPFVREQRRFQAITAAALMLPRALFLEYGGFYEEYRNGFEDVDLCLRINRQGRYFTCIAESAVYHLESRTPGRKDNDRHNAALLSKRCAGQFITDKHRFGLKDGLLPFINDNLEIALRMTDREEERLCRQAEEQPDTDWIALFQNNPLWIKGREQLALRLESQGHYSEAALFRAEIAGILESVEAVKAFLVCASRARLADVAEQAGGWYKNLSASRADEKRARSAVRRIRAMNDPFLDRLYDAMLRELFP